MSASVPILSPTDLPDPPTGARLVNFASLLEPTTREQAERTASLPFVWPHLALMPDAHLVVI